MSAGSSFDRKQFHAPARDWLRQKARERLGAQEELVMIFGEEPGLRQRFTDGDPYAEPTYLGGALNRRPRLDEIDGDTVEDDPKEVLEFDCSITERP